MEHVWLARRAATGHAREERDVLRLTGPVMLRVIKRILGSRSMEVEDVLQDASVALLAALKAFRGECTLRHYAGRIAARHAIRARRKRDRDRAKVIALTQWAGVDAERKASAFDRLEDQRLLEEVLAKLPSEQAEALTLRVVLGLTLVETSEVVGAPPNTVRSRVRLARERLRQMLVRRGVGT